MGYLAHITTGSFLNIYWQFVGDFHLVRKDDFGFYGKDEVIKQWHYLTWKRAEFICFFIL